jgi:hypothetical protein
VHFGLGTRRMEISGNLIKLNVSDPESGSEGRNLIGREHFPPYSVNI